MYRQFQGGVMVGWVIAVLLVVLNLQVYRVKMIAIRETRARHRAKW